MYAHDIQSYGDIARLFDVLIARDAVFSLYLFASIVLARADELFDTPEDEPEMLHSLLSKLPKPLDLESLISDAIALFERHPPETLKGWGKVSRNSVLKTTRWTGEAGRQTLRDGEGFFERQVRELEWAERRERFEGMLWAYRRPAGMVGVAVLVGLLSFYIRKSSGSSGLGFVPVLQRWLRVWGF